MGERNQRGALLECGTSVKAVCPGPIPEKGENVIDILDLHEKEPKPVRGMKERNKEPGKINTKNLDNQW